MTLTLPNRTPGATRSWKYQFVRECGHQQHQQCADDAERDDHAALRVLRLGRGHALAQRGVIGRVHGDRGEGDGRDVVRGGTLRGKG
ncbi:MAG: hypothetical protein ACLVI6_05150 [Bifidobacterium bifidum]